jgi:hypothetical protein
VFGIPFVLFGGLILHLSYVQGSVLLDAGLVASLIWHSDVALTMPAILGGNSFFSTHFTLVFLVIGVVSRFLPLTMAQFFAVFIGVSHAMPALGAFWVLVSGYGMRTGTALVASAATAIIFAFNGIALAIIRFPHFEMLIVGSFILFATALVLRYLRLAVLFFVIGLATREDAGFHFFAVLFLLAALNRRHGVSWRAQRTVLALAVVALLYSVCAIVVQHVMFPGDQAFVRIYLGDPPFGGLAIATVLGRTFGYVIYRAYIVLPAIAAFVWAWRTRNAYIVLGYVAFVPWGFLHVLAASSLAGALSGYYAYPHMIASFWPLLGVLFERQRLGMREGAAPVVSAFLLMITLSFVGVWNQYNPARIDLVRAFFEVPSLARQNATEAAIQAVVSARSLLGRFIVDNGVLGVAPGAFALDESVYGKTSAPDTIVFFKDGFDAQGLRSIANEAGLDRHYVIPRTSLRIATNRPLDSVPGLGSLLQPATAEPQ